MSEEEDTPAAALYGAHILGTNSLRIFDAATDDSYDKEIQPELVPATWTTESVQQHIKNFLDLLPRKLDCIVFVNDGLFKLEHVQAAVAAVTSGTIVRVIPALMARFLYVTHNIQPPIPESSNILILTKVSELSDFHILQRKNSSYIFTHEFLGWPANIVSVFEKYLGKYVSTSSGGRAVILYDDRNTPVKNEIIEKLPNADIIQTICPEWSEMLLSGGLNKAATIIYEKSKVEMDVNDFTIGCQLNVGAKTGSDGEKTVLISVGTLLPVSFQKEMMLDKLVKVRSNCTTVQKINGHKRLMNPYYAKKLEKDMYSVNITIDENGIENVSIHKVGDTLEQEEGFEKKEESEEPEETVKVLEKIQPSEKSVVADVVQLQEVEKVAVGPQPAQSDTVTSLLAQLAADLAQSSVQSGTVESQPSIAAEPLNIRGGKRAAQSPLPHDCRPEKLSKSAENDAFPLQENNPPQERQKSPQPVPRPSPPPQPEQQRRERSPQPVPPPSRTRSRTPPPPYESPIPLEPPQLGKERTRSRDRSPPSSVVQASEQPHRAEKERPRQSRSRERSPLRHYAYSRSRSPQRSPEHHRRRSPDHYNRRRRSNSPPLAITRRRSSADNNNSDALRSPGLSAEIAEKKSLILPNTHADFMVCLNDRHCCICLPDAEGGNVTTRITNVNGHKWTPMYVSFLKVPPALGEVAMADMKVNPEGVLYDICKFICVPFKDIEINPEWAFNVAYTGKKTQQTVLEVQTWKGPHAVDPINVLALIFVGLQKEAERVAGKQMKRVFVKKTRPVGKEESNAIKEAIKIARLECAGIETMPNISVE